MQNKSKLTVLIAPLNWGLGHATRCMPIINELLAKGARVVLASDGKALDVLKAEYPNLPHYELPSWDITYPEKGSDFAWHMLMQSGKVFFAIKHEKKAIEAIVSKEKIDVVISDNRLGAKSDKAYSIIMTHQAFLQTPFLKKLLNYFNHRYIRRFNDCWIIDFPGENNLSGTLSHQESIPFKHRFSGLLSRFTPSQHIDSVEEIDLLAIISGPEPQRSLFEEELMPQLEKLNLKSVVLLGKPGEKLAARVKGNLKIFPHLSSQEIEKHLRNAKVVISRTGYTTVMDLALLGKKAILVPTPGQTEQEYLAKHYDEKGWYVLQKQGEINLEAALNKLKNCNPPKFEGSNYLSKAIDELFILKK